MKKLLLSATLILSVSTLAIADKNRYEITPMIGYNIAEGNINMKDDGYPVYGIEFQANSATSNWSPELSLLYSNDAKYDQGSAESITNILRVATNAVYTFDTDAPVIPFAKLGLGYEDVSKEVRTNDSSLFLSAGAGVKVPFTDMLALKLEAIYMLKDIGSRSDSNLAVMAGLNFAFGDIGTKPAKKVVKKVVKTPKVVVLDDDKDGIPNEQDKCYNTPLGANVDFDGCTLVYDSDKDGVSNSEDRCPNTAKGLVVDSKGCPLDGDDDNDGVLNKADKCKNSAPGANVDSNGCVINPDLDGDGVLNEQDLCSDTVAGATVNSDGCPESVNLHVLFENNSFAVKADSMVKIERVADFLNRHRNYSAKLVGYTDSRGKASYNQTLSEKRAKAVATLLVTKGAPTSSISHAGKGEANPIANNNTKEGRAENRRIEAELTKH